MCEISHSTREISISTKEADAKKALELKFAA